MRSDLAHLAILLALVLVLATTGGFYTTAVLTDTETVSSEFQANTTYDLSNANDDSSGRSERSASDVDGGGVGSSESTADTSVGPNDKDNDGSESPGER